MRVLRRLLMVVVALVVVAAIGIGVFLARFDPNAYKPQIVAAVEKATGRRFAIAGPIRLALSLTPTISAAGVRLAGAPGGPDLLDLAAVSARFSLPALLQGRLQLDRLDLEAPRIALVIDQAGRGNWQFAPAPAAGGAGTPATPGRPAGGQGLTLAIRSVRLHDARVSFADARSGRHVALAIASLALSAAGPAAPLHLAARAVLQGLPLELAATTGSLGAIARARAWPVDATVKIAGASLRARGTLDRPLQFAGYRLAVSAAVPVLARLAPLLPGVALPPAEALAGAARIAGTGAGMPAVSDLVLTAGHTDLGAYLPGFVLDQGRIAASGPGAEVQIALAGSRNGASVTLAGTVGPLFGLPKGKPAPVALILRAGPARLSADGTVADPRVFGGARIALQGAVPALAALGRLVGRPLPALVAAQFSGTLVTGAAGPAQRVAIEGLKLAAPGIDLAGTLSARLAGRPALAGSLHANSLDLDTLARLLPAPAAAKAAAGSPPPAAPAAPARRAGLLVPPLPLPWAALGTLDANLSLAAARVVWGGVTYRDFEAHLVLAGGRLAVAPLALRMPGGLVQGTASADAGGAVSLALRAPGLALAPLLAAYHLPAEASGTLEAFLTMAGRGTTAQAVVGGLSGSAGVAMVDGTIDGRLIGRLLGQGLRSAGLPALLAGRQGAERVRCLAVRLDARGGMGRFPALLLKSSRSYVEGGGGTSFGAETLALDLAPRVETAGRTEIVPVHVGGTWAAPKVTVKPGTALATGARVLGQITQGRAGLLGQLGQVLAPAQGRALPPEQACAPALAAARGGVPGPMPAPRPAAAPAAPAAPASPATPGLPQPLLRLLP